MYRSHDNKWGKKFINCHLAVWIITMTHDVTSEKQAHKLLLSCLKFWIMTMTHEKQVKNKLINSQLAVGNMNMTHDITSEKQVHKLSSSDNNTCFKPPIPRFYVNDLQNK